MTTSFVYYFQLKIHETLTGSEKIKEKVQGFYLSTIQDGQYPFILINVLQIEDKSTVPQLIYGVDFEICIFARDNNKKELLSISDLVLEAIQAKNLNFHGYKTAGVNLNDLSFNDAKDLVHNKLTMRYKALIKCDLK